MPTAAEVHKQIAACKHRYIFFTRKEIRALPKLLLDGEAIHALTSGLMDGDTWLIVCTNRRVMFVNRGMVYGMRQVQVPLDRIQSIDHESGLFFGSLRIFDGSTSFTVRWVLKRSILPFIRNVQENMLLFRQTMMRPGGAAPQAPASTADQLQKLADLLERGMLTEEEFAVQKKKLLG